MMWEVGDLAVHIGGGCSLCTDNPADHGAGRPTKGLLTVVEIDPPCPGVDTFGLRFDRDTLQTSNEFWCSCLYRKVVQDKREACEDEFVTLLRRSRTPAQVE